MRLQTTVVVKNNQIIISDKEILRKMVPGQKVLVTIEDIDQPLLSSGHENKKEIINKLERFARNSKILTPDGLIKREDAYGER